MSAPAFFSVARLLVDGGGIVEGERFLVLVVIVLRLLRHGEGTGDRDLDHPVGIGAQELDIAHFDRMPAPDRADDARHDALRPGAAHGRAGVLDIDAVKRRREAVGIAFAADLAIGDDVDAGALHVADGEDGRVILRRLQKRLADAPQIGRAHARHAQARAVDEPVGLRIGADDRGREARSVGHQCRSRLLGW